MAFFDLCSLDAPRARAAAQSLFTYVQITMQVHCYSSSRAGSKFASVLLARETVATPLPGLQCRSRGSVLYLRCDRALIFRVIVKPDEAVDLRRIPVGQ